MKAKVFEKKLVFVNKDEALDLLGPQDENLKYIKNHTPARIFARGNEVVVSGDKEEVLKIHDLFEELLKVSRNGHPIGQKEIDFSLNMLRQGRKEEIAGLFKEVICISKRGRLIKPKTMGQKAYVEAMRTHDIVFAIGPAGTGKTYLAIAMAISDLMKKKIGRIILTRPAVEAGEKLGFLPGDLQEKVDPYLRPLYDALYDILGVAKIQSLFSQGIIEIAPLAFMRGRTLNDSFVILDEAQNTTPEQMKMFLTRLGFDSKAVITGDITQIDLKGRGPSGLVQSQEILGEIEGISFIYFTRGDVVRHVLVQHIVKAYEKYEKKRREGDAENTVA